MQDNAGGRPPSIIIGQDELEELRLHAVKNLPFESCALLLGQDCAVKSILTMQNADASSVTFRVEPEELLAAYESAEKSGFQVVGIFHSHPGPPTPSPTDVRFMMINPVTWVIYSTTEGRFEAHVLDDAHPGRVTQVSIDSV